MSLAHPFIAPAILLAPSQACPWHISMFSPSPSAASIMESASSFPTHKHKRKLGRCYFQAKITINKMCINAYILPQWFSSPDQTVKLAFHSCKRKPNTTSMFQTLFLHYITTPNLSLLNQVSFEVIWSNAGSAHRYQPFNRVSIHQPVMAKVCFSPYNRQYMYLKYQYLLEIKVLGSINQ